MTGSRAQGLRSQNEQVVTFTLVELLTALTFIAMLLALVLRTEALANLDPARENVRRLQTELEETRKDLKAAEREITILQSELEAQRSLVRRLMAEAGQPLPPNDVVVVDAQTYNGMRNSGEIAEEQQETIQGLQEQIAALKGGATLVRPTCTTNSGYLLNIELNSDGTFTPRPAWSAVASGSVARIDGISTLTSGTISQRTFQAAAARADTWARGQEVPCAFRVRVGSGHSNLPLYLRQLAVVEQYFYVYRTR